MNISQSHHGVEECGNEQLQEVESGLITDRVTGVDMGQGQDPELDLRISL